VDERSVVLAGRTIGRAEKEDAVELLLSRLATFLFCCFPQARATASTYTEAGIFRLPERAPTHTHPTKKPNSNKGEVKNLVLKRIMPSPKSKKKEEEEECN
jgi:hypothetical protein